MRMSENGSKYPKSDDSHLKSDNSIRNGTKTFKIERKCPKSDGCAQKRTEGSEIGQNCPNWTNLPKIWSNSLKLGGEVLPVSRRRYFSVESSIRFTDLGPKYSERAFPLFPVIVLTQDKSNFFFLKGPRQKEQIVRNTFAVSQETIATIVFRLLDRVVAAELIPSAIAKYIAPYMVHHSLDRDTMLLRYIEVSKLQYITSAEGSLTNIFRFDVSNFGLCWCCSFNLFLGLVFFFQAQVTSVVFLFPVYLQFHLNTLQLPIHFINIKISSYSIQS